MSYVTEISKIIQELGNRYPPVGALAYKRGKARAIDLPSKLYCTDQLNQKSSQSDWFQNLACNFGPFGKKSYEGRGWKECKYQLDGINYLLKWVLKDNFCQPPTHTNSNFIINIKMPYTSVLVHLCHGWTMTEVNHAKMTGWTSLTAWWCF